MHNAGPGRLAGFNHEGHMGKPDLPVLDAAVELVDEMYTSGRYPEAMTLPDTRE
jgi:hypothetical protein